MMKMKRVAALTMAGVMAATSLTACGSSSSSTTETTASAAETVATAETEAEAGEGSTEAPENVITINVGYENATTEPAAKAVEKWKELVEERSNGSIVLELFPNSALGAKSNLIDQMIMGENVLTGADGAFLADNGVPDFGVFYAPFAFDNWDEEWAVIDSDWYAGLCDQLASTGGLRVLSSNWIYGARDIMSTKQVVLPEDLAGMKMRVSANDLSITSFNDLGAAALGMDMGDVYQALQAGTIDAVENPVVSLANRSFQEVAKNVVRTGHILAVSMWICGESFYETLTPEQQQILCECADEAGLYNNELQDEAEANAIQILEDAGVTITELTDEQKAAWIEAGQYFYENDTDSLGWTPGLYDTVKAAAK
ncbi:MAG: C4-dicarboxylate TRAP transporter substrate-binding protein [Clostridiales bacterium]|nr:C4-dicarboxylate TRAP transporter substrate-binding protein [Clostridiales bacterium]